MSTMKAPRTGFALCGVLHLPKIYKKDTNSMSASEIETNETLVSADTDLTKLSAEELLAVVAELRQENKVLKKAKDKVGLTFKRVPEDGNDSIVRLEDNQFPFLTKVESLSVTKPETIDGNIALIEGENLAALATLQMTHKEKVDVIYIDPPYNTGNDDFIYEDKRMYKSDESDLENLEETLDGKARTVGKDDPFRHSKWLSFMERRLFLAKELLNDTGVIFVSIDDNEQARLKLLMDSIFGVENFINQFVWVNNLKGRQISNRGAAKTYEYILVYSKSFEKALPFNISASYAQKMMPASYGNKNYEIKTDSISSYVIKNELHNTNSVFNEETRPNLVYNIHYNPSNGNIEFSDVTENIEIEGFVKISPYKNNNGKHKYHAWRWGKKKVLTETFDLEFVKTNSGYKVFTKIREFDLTYAKDIVTNIGAGDISAILGRSSFDYPKPSNLLKFLIKIASPKDALILDFFAGSGTTGHAAAELNKEDGGNRSAILVTNNEGGIARNVTRERLARVLTGENWADGKEHEALPGNLSYYRLDFKKLSANPLSTAQMMESKFDGLLSLENNALTVVENNPDEDYAIYRNSGKVVFVWKNLFSLYDGECEELLESLKASTKADEFIAYVPSDSLDAGITVDGWKIIPFPHDYINRYEAMIATMRRNKTLPNSK